MDESHYRVFWLDPNPVLKKKSDPFLSRSGSGFPYTVESGYDFLNMVQSGSGFFSRSSDPGKIHPDPHPDTMVVPKICTYNRGLRLYCTYNVKLMQETEFNYGDVNLPDTEYIDDQDVNLRNIFRK